MKIREEGQALVEMAVILPILLMMLLGIFEVGWVIRDQMILDTGSREAARFATKPSRMILDDYESALISYDDILTQMDASMGGLLQNEVEGVIVTNLYVQAGFPCDPEEREDPLQRADGSWDAWPNCDCTTAVTSPYTPSISISHETEGFEHYRHQIGPYESRIDVPAKLLEMSEFNYKLNCNMAKSFPGMVASDQHHMIIVELFYSHDQLLGAPLISNSLTDPIPLRSYTAMRKVSDRSY